MLPVLSSITFGWPGHQAGKPLSMASKEKSYVFILKTKNPKYLEETGCHSFLSENQHCGGTGNTFPHFSMVWQVSLSIVMTNTEKN